MATPSEFFRQYQRFHYNQQRQMKYDLAYEIILITFRMERLLEQAIDKDLGNLPPADVLRYANLSREKSTKTAQLREIANHEHDI